MSASSFPPQNSAAAGASAGRHAATFRLAGIALLILALLLPLGMIGSVLRERLQRRHEAVAEITGTWGRDQAVLGPVLVVPYRARHKIWREISVEGRVEKREVDATRIFTAFFLPSELVIEGRLAPERLHRGIYDAVVYRSTLTLSGRFEKPDFAPLKIEADEILWPDAVVTLAVSDLRGAGETLRLAWGKEEIPFVPGSRLPGWSSGVHARLGARAAQAGGTFRLPLDFRGSGALQFVPAGRQTVVHLASEWPDPSFRGAFAPSERKITPQGFTAIWKAAWYGRGFPQRWTDAAAPGLDPAAVNASLFGVQLMPKLDAYRLVERSIKYGALFFTFVFAAFVLSEARAKARMHAVQYLLVGAALCLFYLLLLSLSELWRFGLAYLVASAASTLLVAAYCAAVFRSAGRGRQIAAWLALAYGWLYVVLTLQDWSLLVGAIGLFLALAAVMYLTRDADWSAGGAKPRVVPPAPKGLRPAPKTMDV